MSRERGPQIQVDRIIVLTAEVSGGRSLHLNRFSKSRVSRFLIIALRQSQITGAANCISLWANNKAHQNR